MGARKVNYAWVRCNTEFVTSNSEGPIVECIRDLFMRLPKDERGPVLERLRADADTLAQNEAGTTA